MLSELQRESILHALVLHPEQSQTEIAKQFGVGRLTVLNLAKKGGVKRQRGAASPAFRHTIAKSVEK